MKYLKIGLILTFCFIAIFLLIKFLLPKKTIQPPSPPEEILSPEEVAIKYFELEQRGNRQEAERHLFSELSKVEIFGEDYRNLRTFLWVPPKEREDSLPEHQLITKEIRENEAEITIEMKTNKMENSLFFNFRLPKKITFKVNLIKENGKWKIIEIDSPDLVLEKKFGEKGEIKENVFVKPMKVGDYQTVGIKPSEEFNKFLFLEVEYENRSSESMSFSSLIEWRIFNENREFYNPIPNLTLGPERVVIPDIKLDPGSTKRSYVFFEVFKEFTITEVVFQNLDKKVIFKID